MCWVRMYSRLAPVSLAVAVTMAALPTGINAYLFAARYDARDAGGDQHDPDLDPGLRADVGFPAHHAAR